MIDSDRLPLSKQQIMIEKHQKERASTFNIKNNGLDVRREMSIDQMTEHQKY